MKKILVIDDDPDILEIMQIIFQDSGYEIILSDVTVDTDYVSVIHPDLILLDVRINGKAKAGPKMCKQFKADQRTALVPVILLSAEDDLKTIANQCNADTFINKPFSIGTLLSTVNKYLS